VAGYVLQAVGDDLVDSVVSESIPILTEEEKFNEAVSSIVRRVEARLTGAQPEDSPHTFPSHEFPGQKCSASWSGMIGSSSRGCPEWRGRDAQYDFPRSAEISLSFYGERSSAPNENRRGLLALQEREQLPLQGCLGSTAICRVPGPDKTG
jgi:hypothetical protein